MSVLVSFFCFDKNTDKNQLGEERVYFTFLLTVSSLRGTRGRAQEPGAQTVEVGCLLTYSSSMCSACFFF